MGCYLRREKLKKEDFAYELIEKLLKFHNSDAFEIDLVIRKYSDENKINEANFLKIIERLNLATEIVINDATILQFYENFKFQGLFELNDLLVLGILLGKGENLLKAKLIFRIFDRFGQKKIEKFELEVIFNSISLIVIDRIHILVKERNISEISTEFLDIYNQKLKKKQSKMKKVFVSLFKIEKDVITLNNFLAVFENINLGTFFTTTGFREFLLSIKFNKISQINYYEKSSKSESLILTEEYLT